ncbi:hypothetical protein L596_003992 [Steinernema carpocapsae]|uniref:3-hydroxyisobutyryl-coenzyme A hydrolase n=1 Tax=Steinernema carpocapsae TaxID=34508 RepID=A0A4U8UUG4_STECR|nr:hypothetical protein L596_003992 [Steinernema carpocapsae]
MRLAPISSNTILRARNLVTARNFSSNSSWGPLDWENTRAHFSRFVGGSVTVTKDDRLATIVLNNPGKKNSLSGKMMVDLENCVRELESWNGTAVVITGTEGDFCTGGDLEFVKKTATPEDGNKMISYLGRILNRLRRRWF